MISFPCEKYLQRVLLPRPAPRASLAHVRLQECRSLSWTLYPELFATLRSCFKRLNPAAPSSSCADETLHGQIADSTFDVLNIGGPVELTSAQQGTKAPLKICQRCVRETLAMLLLQEHLSWHPIFLPLP